MTDERQSSVRLRKGTTAAASNAVDHKNRLQETRKHVQGKDQGRPSAQDLTWYPPFQAAFKLILVTRLLSAIFANIQDCDETFNYWEPLHYLHFGQGFQTWEYAKQYALRSWVYIILHAVASIAGELSLLGGTQKISIFYAVRGVLGCCSAYTEACLYQAIASHVHPQVAIYTLVFLMSSTGMFISSTSFLPSAFAMYCVTLAYSFSWEPSSLLKTLKITALFALGALVGWPFSAALAIPYILSELARPQLLSKLLHFFISAIASAVLILLPLVLIDRQFYHEWIIVPLNLVVYNVFNSNSGGANLYGTEPIWFYFANLFLNFNLVSFLAIGYPIAAMVYVCLFRQSSKGSSLLHSSLFAFLGWLVFMSAQPHKEERFLYVIYPLLCFYAAWSLYLFEHILSSSISGNTTSTKGLSQKLAMAVIVASVGLSLSRTFGNYMFYHAPIKHNRSIQVCVGEEWYRFPSHYFLPLGVRLGYLRTNFKGILPKYFASQPPPAFKAIGLEGLLESGRIDDYSYALRFGQRLTHLHVDGMNDENREEMDRYVQDVSSCDFLVATKRGSNEVQSVDDHYEEEYIRYARGSNRKWSQVICVPFLDAERSSRIGRMFYLPGILGSLAWKEYCLFEWSE